ncbi:metallophosphoesterase, partial [bacterium]|nr:metallophosphoesterase [bacterium]
PEGSSENIFYVDVQGIRLIGLDSNIDPKSQAVWLEEVLKNNPNRWTIVTHHHPIHSTSRGRDNAGLRDAWQPLYDKYGVDLVLQGHDHSYGRTAPLERNETSGKQVVREQTGTVYVVSVSGPKQYSLKDYEEAEENPFESRGEDLQLYQVIDVTHDRISYQAKT